MNTPAPKMSFAGGMAIFLIVAALIVGLRWQSLQDLFYGDQFPPTAFQWEHDWSRAEALAQEQGKALLVVFSASWCPPCKAMKRAVWPNAIVGEEVSANYVPLYVDVDLPEHEKKVSQYQVTGIPLVAILDKDGKVVRQANYMTSEEALAFLRMK